MLLQFQTCFRVDTDFYYKQEKSLKKARQKSFVTNLNNYDCINLVGYQHTPAASDPE